MSYYKFEQNDIFTNRIKAHPRCYFLIHNNKTYYNDIVPQATVDSESILDVPQGFISLYEMNINRLNGANDSNLIYPYITKQGTLGSFKSISTESFQGFGYGDIISGSYPLSASISTDFYTTTDRDRIHALKNTFNYYKPLSRHYSYETVDWNKSEQDIKLVSIPSIFYGSSIKKGSVKMNFYIEGELIATIEDTARNGELIQTLPTDANEGKVAGVVLYNEGFVALTGSWDLSNTHQEEYISGEDPETPKWKYWGERDRAEPYHDFAKSSSWDIDFLGTNYIPTMTMLAHAKQGDLNYSNNPTFIDFEDRNDGNPFRIVTQEMIDDASLEFTQDDLGKVDFQNGGSLNKFVEDKDLHIANITNTPYAGATGSFEKTTYISKIGIYDEDKNLIGIAKLATPVKKTESRQYTFKMKVDF